MERELKVSEERVKRGWGVSGERLGRKWERDDREWGETRERLGRE